MILELLRTETAAAHQSLEEEVDIPSIVQEPARYQALLERFFGFHAAFESLEQTLTGWAEAGYEPEQRLKSPWLAEDLRALGLSPAEIDQLPRCTALPALPSLAAGFGCAYVLEGSTLGGRHIARFFAEGPAATLPRRFFQGYGDLTGPRWKSFCQALEAYASAHPQEQADLVAAARDTFTSFEAWVRPPNYP